MSKFKRTDKKRPILINKKTKIFELFPSGVYGSGLKVKDFQSILKSSKKGNKLGGVIKAESGTIVTPRMSRYVSDTLKSADEGAYRIGSKLKEKSKSILSKVKEKIAKASEIMRKGPTAASVKGATKFTGDTAPLSKPKLKSANRPGKLPDRPGSKINIGKSKALVTGRTAKLFKAARFARAVTPIGAASIVIGAGVKKRDAKAIKRERDFYKGKKYKDVGFESMMDYAKPKKKGGAISYNKGGFNYAINKKRERDNEIHERTIRR